ncbi:dihydrofolate reductase [Candidatus Roizmanbacteria bacterium]|nr:dihydrofolate reductase [Candidatus Roizmanbacteria bacterium]
MIRIQKPRLSIIVAVGENREIGKDNQLLWHISADLKRFKSLTSGHPVIMGRKTFDSIGRPLPNRLNIIVTRDTTIVAEGCTVVHSLEEAIFAAQQTETEEVFVIGGGSLYEQALPLAERLYITLVHTSFEADTFFPEYHSQFPKIIEQEEGQTEDVKYTFLVLEK